LTIDASPRVSQHCDGASSSVETLTRLQLSREWRTGIDAHQTPTIRR